MVYKREIDNADLTSLAEIMGITLDDMPHMAYPENLPSSAVDALYAYGRTNWYAMRLAQNPFTYSLHCNPSIINYERFDYFCPECSHEYMVDTDMNVTTTLRNG